jgi:hypothetical protein
MQTRSLEQEEALEPRRIERYGEIPHSGTESGEGEGEREREIVTVFEGRRREEGEPF